MNKEKEFLIGKTRIKIFVGEFGSGKTEIAINYSLKLKEQQVSTAIVDMDLVKPYFRTRENREFLEKQGIVVACPDSRLANADLPIMPQQVTALLHDERRHIVIDVGGGEASIVLAQVEKQLNKVGSEVYFVINTCRPFTQNVEDIKRIIKKTEELSKLKITSLVCNTNIGKETTFKEIVNGLKIVEAVSKEARVPISWVSISKEIFCEQVLPYPIMDIDLYTKYPWMDTFPI